MGNENQMKMQPDYQIFEKLNIISIYIYLILTPLTTTIESYWITIFLQGGKPSSLHFQLSQIQLSFLLTSYFYSIFPMSNFKYKLGYRNGFFECR